MGWVEQLPDGRWRAFESEGAGGRRLRANATRRTRTEARNAAKARLERKLKESTLEPHALTLSAYLERWVKHEKTQGRGGKSMARDEGITLKLPKALAALKLSEVAPLAMQKWLDEAQGVAPATVRKRYTVLHSALERAVGWKLLLENPMDAVTPPVLPDTEMLALSEVQTTQLLAAIPAGRYSSPALVAVTTGLRRGELLALRWRDVDLKEATLTVARTCDEVPRQPIRYKAPKGRKGKPGKKRTIALMAATVRELDAHRKRQVAERLAAKTWHEHGLVFPDPHGEPWRPSTFSVGWGRLIKALTTGTDDVPAVLPPVFKTMRFHDLRHTHATQLLRAGVPVEAVSKRLGHSNPVITMRVYAHVLDDADEAAVALLEVRLGNMLEPDRDTECDTSQ